MSLAEIISLDASRLADEHVVEWLGRTTPELFREYLSPSEEERARLLKARLESLLGKGGEALACDLGDALAAIMGVEDLAWDREHFGFGCVRLSPLAVAGDLAPEGRTQCLQACLDAGIAAARRLKARLVQRRLTAARMDEIRMLEANGFYLADNVLVTSARLEKCRLPEAGGGAVVRDCLPSDLERIEAMCAGSFPHSRFVSDPVFDPAKGEQVYVKWMKNAFGNDAGGRDFSGTHGLTADIDGVVAGFLVFQVQAGDGEGAPPVRRMGEISLFVVDPGARGKGVGTALMRGCLDRAADLGVTRLEATTWVQNRGALAIYQKAGLAVVDNLLCFHKVL